MEKSEIAVFGGGCFWCTEALFSKLKGVFSVTSGYAGGKMESPSYHDVTTGETGHAEVIKIKFDPKIISYDTLLDVFWNVHDPTTMNRQGPDVGTQYRSIILYTTEQQKKKAEESKRGIEASVKFKVPVVTEIQLLDKFYEAEEYHQQFYSKNPTQPYCQVVISPKIQHFLDQYSHLLK